MTIPFNSTRAKAESLFKQMYCSGATYEEIGKVLGVSRQRAEQLRHIYKVPPISKAERCELRGITSLSVITDPKEKKAYIMLAAARARAKLSNLLFNLEVLDIDTPDICPVLKTRLEYENEGLLDNSPSLDRIVPSLGYIKGNIKTISWRANRLKNDGTLKDFKAIVDYLQAWGGL